MSPFSSTRLGTLRHSLFAALVAIAGPAAPAGAQAPQPQQPSIPSELQNLTDTFVTVTIPRLENGQTVTQPFVPSPSTSAGVMSINGEWPIAIVGGGEGQVNRKIRAVLRSPFGQVVANGCGYSKTAKPTSASTAHKPAMFASGQFQPRFQDAVGQWNVTVSYCDDAAPSPSGPSRVLGEIKIFVSYRAAR